MRKFVLGGIVVLAFLLRTIAISSYPAGFTADEASFGYDAYSLLRTGRDQWGESWPLTLRSFGDFKLPVYAYLTIPSVAIFGLNEFAVRFPNAVLGVAAVAVVYLLVVELFSSVGPAALYPAPTSSRKTLRALERGPLRASPAETLGMLSAFLLAISPWHISLSRGAFEANLTTFLIPLGLWAFFRGLQQPRFWAVAALAFGFNLFTYHSARLFTPLLVTALIWWKRRELRDEVVRYKLGIAIFAGFILIAGYTMLTGAGARVSDVGIFNPTDRWKSVSDRRYEAVLQGVPDQISRIFSNKVVFVFDQFISGYLSYLSPQFLFTQGAGEASYGMIPGRGVVYLIELPFILGALWFFVKRKKPEIGFLLVWILLAPIPAALAKGPGLAANRAAVMIPAVQVLSAYGAVVLYESFAKWRWIWIKRALLFGFIVALFISLIFFLEDYRFHAARVNAPSMSFGWRDAIEFLKTVEGDYKEIVIARDFSEPQIFVAFYKKWDPADFARESWDWRRYEELGLLFVDQLSLYKLGKYTFRGIDFLKDKNLKNTLLVGRLRDFPGDVVVEKEIIYPDGSEVILIVDPSRQKVYAKAY